MRWPISKKDRGLCIVVGRMEVKRKIEGYVLLQEGWKFEPHLLLECLLYDSDSSGISVVCYPSFAT